MTNITPTRASAPEMREALEMVEASGEARDPDTEILHAAHAAWNALACSPSRRSGWPRSRLRPARRKAVWYE